MKQNCDREPLDRDTLVPTHCEAQVSYIRLEHSSILFFFFPG